MQLDLIFERRPPQPSEPSKHPTLGTSIGWHWVTPKSPWAKPSHPDHGGHWSATYAPERRQPCSCGSTDLRRINPPLCADCT